VRCRSFPQLPADLAQHEVLKVQGSHLHRIVVT